MDMSLRDKSVNTYVVVTLLAATTLLVGLFSAVGYKIVHYKDTANLRKELAVTADQLSRGLSLPAWNFDEKTINSVLDGMMSDPSVLAVEVKTGNRSYDRARDEKWNIVREARPFPGGGVISPEERTILHSGRAIGTVRIAATMRFVNEERSRDALFLIGIVLFFDVGLIICLYLLLNRKVLVPLKKLDRFVAGVMHSAGGESRRMIVGEAFQGELETLRTSIIAMVDTLDDRYQEQIRSKSALRESEARFRSTFEQAAMGIAHVDPDGRWLRVNNKLCELLGYTREELLTMSFQDITHPDDLEDDLRLVRLVLADEIKTYSKEKRYFRKDGSLAWINRTVSLVRDESGQPEYFISASEDITEKKKAEEEKERLQSQLQQAMKMEAVGRLAGGVAHDFNNLLTVIMGNASLALGKVSPSEPVGEMLSEVNKAAERAARLTQQLLAFSRKQLIEPKVLDLNALIVDLHRMLVRLIGENIELSTVPGEGLGAVKVDPGQFEQVLVNLAVNARDAMPDGGRLRIETSNAELDEGYCVSYPDATPGDYVLLSVSDTGHGMSEEVKSRVFEPFFTTKETGSGTGLGLSMTYGAVKQSGGSIAVYSEAGKGTTVRIYLPRVEMEGEKAGDLAPSQELLDGTETVLLVEDEETLRKLGVLVLDRLGYKVLEASRGSEAIAVAKGYGGPIHLLLTDVVMPGMNGAELASQLLLLHPEAKVLFTSGYTENAIVHHGVLDEGVSFIGKPYTPSVLARKIREVLDKA